MRRCCRSRTPARRGANGRTCGLALCRCSLVGRPKERALTRSLRDLTPVREMGEGKSGCLAAVERVGCMSHPLRHDARNRVGRAAGRERDDKAGRARTQATVGLELAAPVNSPLTLKPAAVQFQCLP